MVSTYRKTIIPNKTYFGSYPRSFRIHVHQLIAWGFQDAYPIIKSNNEQEPAITGYIAEAIEELLLTNRFNWFNYYAVKDDPPVKKKGASGRSRPRSDVNIQATFLGRPEYIFEAKRLRKNGYGTNKYIGSNGMGCFIQGLYASRYDEAGMLGYVQSHSIEYWQSEIEAAIDINAKPLSLNSGQWAEQVISNFPLEWVSKHDRITLGRSINIYHILLNCCVADMRN